MRGQAHWIPRDLHDEPPSSAWHYLPNDGQVFDVGGSFRNDAVFHSVGTYPTIYGMKGNRIAICVPKPDPPAHEHDSLFRVDFAFTGPESHDATPVPIEPTQRRYNFYEQFTPDGITGVTGARRWLYPSVYDSIDVHVYSNRWGPKMYIVIRPGGNPSNIRINWYGHDSLRIDLQGYLDVWFRQQFIKLTQGLAYQQVGSDVVEVPWTADYVIGNGELQTGFEFGEYDPALPLILIVRPFNPDPSMLGGGGEPPPPEWCTFVAGAHDDRMLDLTHDPSGNIYVTGASKSTSGLPIVPGASQVANQGSSDAIVGRFNEFYEIDDGAGWMTYLGAGSEDKGVAIAYDGMNSRVAITGGTWSGSFLANQAFAGNPNSYASAPLVVPSQFIAWFDALAGTRQYLTLTKGTLNVDYDGDIDVDAAGNTYVVGRALALDPLSEGPVNPPGAYVQWNNPWDSNLVIEGTGFVLRLDPQANLTWFTPLGGALTEFVHGCKVDRVNNLLYVVGSTKTPNDPNQNFNCSADASEFEFPLCEYPEGYFQSKLNGTTTIPDPVDSHYDGFIMRFRLSTLGMDWSTYIGGALTEVIFDVAVDTLGQVYVAGYSETPFYAANACGSPQDDGFPHCNAQGFYNSSAAGRRYFIARFDEDAKLNWGTKIGDNTTFANGGFLPISLAIDESNQVYLHHSSYRIPGTYVPPMDLLPSAGLYHRPTHNDELLPGKSDTYVTIFSPATQHLYTTFFGGIGNDIARGITATSDRLYVCGFTLSLLNFPTNAPAIPDHQPYLNATPQAIVAQDRADGYIAQLRNDVTIGVAEQGATTSAGLGLFPNPTDGGVQVVLPDGFVGEGEISVVDELGRVCHRARVVDRRTARLGLHELANGLYTITLTQNVMRWHGRVIVNR